MPSDTPILDSLYVPIFFLLNLGIVLVYCLVFGRLINASEEGSKKRKPSLQKIVGGSITAAMTNTSFIAGGRAGLQGNKPKIVTESTGSGTGDPRFSLGTFGANSEFDESSTNIETSVSIAGYKNSTKV